MTSASRTLPRDEVLRAERLTRRLGGRAVLDGVNLRVVSGEIVAIMGRSGSGKSTLINVLGGLDEPDGGTVKVRGEPFSSLDPDRRAEFRLRNVGIVFQHFNLLPDLTVRENVALPLKLAHVRSEERNGRADTLLRLFGMSEFADRFPDVLSGGELQRVAVARALAHRPGVILADEPTANLDEANAQTVIEALRKAASADAGVVVASHDALVGQNAARRFRIHEGRLQLPR